MIRHYIVTGPEAYRMALPPGQSHAYHHSRLPTRRAATTCRLYAGEGPCEHGYEVVLRGDTAALVVLDHQVAAAVQRAFDGAQDDA